jgi:integral membrane protein
MPTWFRITGRLEGISFLILLFVATPFKYYLERPVLVKIMGPIHGIFFLLYCAGAFWLASEQKWSGKQQIFAYIAAVLPFGTFLFEKKYRPEPLCEPHYQEVLK